MRTRFDIVWTCVTTLFICTWVAIHPNIPPRGAGHVLEENRVDVVDAASPRVSIDV